jgi:hypothetical protein
MLSALYVIGKSQMKQGIIINSKLSVLSRITGGILVFLLVRDGLLISGILPERSPLSYWFGVITILGSLIGIIIGIDACWWHYKKYKRHFFKSIDLELLLRFSVIIYIVFVLLLLLL